MTPQLQKDILKWDIKSWSKPLRYWDKHVHWPNVKNALELGAEDGGISLWLALKGTRVVCSDLEYAQQKAFPLHQKYKVESLVEYQNLDANNLPYENHFDLIVFKSIIGGIGRNDNKALQQKVFEQIYKALKPGGVLLFAENLVGSRMHRYFRKKFRHWGGEWRYPTIAEMNEFLSDFKQVELYTTGVVGTFGRNEKQKSVMAGVDWLILNHVSPKKWRYISYGKAIK